MTHTAILQGAALLDRATRSPWWLPIATVVAVLSWTTAYQVKNGLIQVVLGLRDIQSTATEEALQGISLVLMRAEHAVPPLTDLVQSLFVSILLYSVVTAICPALPRYARGGTIVVVVLSIAPAFLEFY